MTKKDFVELAEQLAIVRRKYETKSCVNHGENWAGKDIWERCVDAVVLACRTTSANFDAQKFRQACNAGVAVGLLWG